MHVGGVQKLQRDKRAKSAGKGGHEWAWLLRGFIVAGKVTKSKWRWIEMSQSAGGARTFSSFAACRHSPRQQRSPGPRSAPRRVLHCAPSPGSCSCSGSPPMIACQCNFSNPCIAPGFRCSGGRQRYSTPVTRYGKTAMLCRPLAARRGLGSIDSAISNSCWAPRTFSPESHALSAWIPGPCSDGSRTTLANAIANQSFTIQDCEPTARIAMS
ncbi:hypothetical protein BD309DRAFT_953932 [Dichomitus squalens]|nr:hypothetical protein BD309DRAFT_953932 [Dichomitus squalens]